MADNPFAARKSAAPPKTRSAEDFLDGGASVAVKFPKEGFEVEGTVLGWQGPVQQIDMNSGEPLFWEKKQKTKESELKFEASKSNPAEQLLIELQCQPTGVTWKTNRYIKEDLPEDDGVRTAYVHGELQKAISKGRREAAQKYNLGRTFAPLEEGARLKLIRGQDRKMPNGMFGFTYSAVWTPAANNPDFTSQADGFLDDKDSSPFEKDTDEPPF